MMPGTYHIVSLFYGLNFMVTAMGPVPGMARAWGWLLLSAGYWAMAGVPERVWDRPFERKFRDGRWVLGHCLLSSAIVLLFADLMVRRFFM